MSAQPWRIINLVLTSWLTLSAFMWPHAPPHFRNVLVVGVLGAVIASLAAITPALRVLNTLLAVWLFTSAWALPATNTATLWNDIPIAIAMFLASLPGATRSTPDSPPPVQRARLHNRWQRAEASAMVRPKS
jgi:hypothetical protein